MKNKIADIELLKIKRNLRKICTCEEKKFTIDTQNRTVWCSICDAYIDPYDAILYLARNIEKYEEQAQYFLNRIKEYATYKPYLRVMKYIEQNYRANNYSMIPRCPKCNEHFHLEELTSWTNKNYIKEE